MHTACWVLSGKKALLWLGDAHPRSVQKEVPSQYPGPPAGVRAHWSGGTWGRSGSAGPQGGECPELWGEGSAGGLAPVLPPPKRRLHAVSERLALAFFQAVLSPADGSRRVPQRLPA